MGDPSGPSKYMWRLDDEKLMYPAYEKMVKAGVRVVCVHKGLLPDNAEEAMPGATAHSDVSDVGKAAKDWPQISWVIYHAGFRPAPRPSAAYEKEFEETGRIDWVSDLARIPETFGVKNVYGEIGSSFAFTCITNPRVCAGMLGTLIKGLGADHVLWGTDSIWYGSPQWQIEALRRIGNSDRPAEEIRLCPAGRRRWRGETHNPRPQCRAPAWGAHRTHGWCSGL